MDPNHPLSPSEPAPNLPQEIQTLHNLSLQGSWLTILTTTTPTTPNPPNPNLTLLTYHVISLTKLRRYSEALTTLETTLPNLPNHPNLPFALRLLHAILPSFVSRRSDSIDRLYLLLSFVYSKPGILSWLRRRKIVVASLIGLHTVGKEFVVAIELLRRLIACDCDNVELLSRLGYVQLQFGDLDGAKSSFKRVELIVDELENVKFRNLGDDQSSFESGDAIVNELEKPNPSDLIVKVLENVQLKNVDGDQSSFSPVELIVNESEKTDSNDSQLMNVDGETIVNQSEKTQNTIVNETEKPKSNANSRKLRNLIGRNRALLCLVGKDYVAAVREYDECISRDEMDIVSINNKALCLMYLRDLSDSIKVIESSLERIPTVALNETVIVNLCSMYELAYVNHTDIKKTLSNWIARLAPDDFDSSCTRV